MKSIYFTIVAVLLSTFVFAQKNQAVYAEFGGNGILYSVNYDFAPIKSASKFRVKAGLSYVGAPIVIGQANYLFGRDKHFCELGVGFTTVTEALTGNSGFQIYPNSVLQYRYEHPKGFLFRVGFAPVYLPITGDGFEGLNIIFWAWPAASVGYAF